MMYIVIKYFLFKSIKVSSIFLSPGIAIFLNIFFCTYFLCEVFVHVQDLGQRDFITYVTLCGISKILIEAAQPPLGAMLQRKCYL